MTQATANDTAAEPVLLYEVRDKVAHITINRPKSMNALNPAVLTGIAESVDRAAADENVKAVVIRGKGGKAFSAGVDLKHFHNEGVIGDVGAHLLFTAKLRDTLIKVEKTPLPVIAVVQGFALAGGLELLLACDFLICSHGSQIGDQHANYGLMAGGGGTQRLPRRIGQQLALELLYTGRRMDGHEAFRTGLALATYADDELDAGVERLLANLRNKSRLGMGFMKSTVHRGMELPLREALDIERLVVQEYFSCYGEANQGVTDFNQKKRTSDL
ncbi:enoyl-CoA hydratase/isomerase family protein [soil metagenome]